MTASTPTFAAIDRAANFLESVQQRLNIKFDRQSVKNVKQDNGAKAVLKRALTGEFRHLRAVYPIVLYPLEREGIQYNQDEWIFVACLFAYYPQPIDRSDKRNLGHSCWWLQQEIRRSSPDAKGVDRRFRALLDTSLEDLRSPLAAMIRLLKSKGVVINYPQLIVDLCRWEHPDQYVQDNWARAFWGAPSKPPEDSEGKTDDVNDD